jgi:hypothetical protein
MKVRADVAELLRAGYSDRTIARQLSMDAKGIAAARAALGLPKAKSGRKPAATPEDLFWRRVQPTEDGHLLWTGHRASRGAATFRHGGRHYTACTVAFRIRHGRDPEGRAQTMCDKRGCVSPHCVADRPMRERADATYAAIFGNVTT